MKKQQILMLPLLLMGLYALAQQPDIRPEDHFWRRRLMSKIDLKEKVNAPLCLHDDPNPVFARYTERNGLVVSLMNGLKEGKYQAFEPDTWQALSFEQVYGRMKYLDKSKSKRQLAIEQAEQASPWTKYEPLPDEEEEATAATLTEMPEENSFVTAVTSPKPPKKAWDIDFSPYEQSIVIIEDWIFDKNRSMMEHRLLYIQIVWIDPTGVLPDKVLCTFAYKDIQAQLENTQWKTRHNDAEVRNLREIFDLRFFNSYIVNVSGKPVQDIYESQKRKEEVIEFESNLWSW